MQMKTIFHEKATHLFLLLAFLVLVMSTVTNAEVIEKPLDGTLNQKIGMDTILSGTSPDSSLEDARVVMKKEAKETNELQIRQLSYGIINIFIFLVVSAGSIWMYRFVMTRRSNEAEQVNQSVANEEIRSRSEDILLNATAESPTEQEPPVEPAGEPEPNKSEQNISDELQKMNASLQELKKAAQEKEKLLQMNSEMHEELVELRNGLADAIKKPLLMGFVQIYDRLEDLVKANSNLSESEISTAKILKTLNDIKLNCLDLLYEFDVEPIEPKIGDAFNPKEHKAIKTIMTDDAVKDRTISSVRQIGFVNVSNSRMLRVGSVEVYKKQE